MADASEELSAREIEILGLVATGATNLQVAQELGISVNTVKAHLRRIFAKLEVESRTEATTCALQLGVIRLATGEDDSGSPEAVTPRRQVAEEEHVLALHARPAQLVVLALGLMAVLAAAFWPGPRTALARGGSRFVDAPAGANASAGESTTLRWTQRSPLPTERSRFAQARVDGRIYVIGGMTDEGFSATVASYDPTEDRWISHAPKPTAVANVGAAVVGGRIYVPGGYDASGDAVRVMEVYDPAADAWSRAADLPIPLFAYAIAEYGDGFYVFGGHDGRGYVADAYRYDADADVWHRAGGLDSPRGFMAAAAAGDAIYVVGGYDGAAEYATCASYHPSRAAAEEDPWEDHAPVGSGRAGHSLAAVDGKLYVVGGGWDTPLYYNEVYDVAHDVWSTFPSPVIGEWRTLGLSSVGAHDGTRLYAIGGWSGRPLGLVQVYQATYRVYAPLQ